MEKRDVVEVSIFSGWYGKARVVVAALCAATKAVVRRKARGVKRARLLRVSAAVRPD